MHTMVICIIWKQNSHGKPVRIQDEQEARLGCWRGYLPPHLRFAAPAAATLITTIMIDIALTYA
jgi:hypothetical protein